MLVQPLVFGLQYACCCPSHDMCYVNLRLAKKNVFVICPDASNKIQHFFPYWSQILLPASGCFFSSTCWKTQSNQNS